MLNVSALGPEALGAPDGVPLPRKLKSPPPEPKGLGGGPVLEVLPSDCGENSRPALSSFPLGRASRPASSNSSARNAQ